jgi:hypothetical protein
MRGPLLIAGAVLALLARTPGVHAGELGGEDSCSRADAHSAQPHEGAPTRIETVEAALAIEATRPLPAFVATGAAAAPVESKLADDTPQGANRTGAAPVQTPPVEGTPAAAAAIDRAEEFGTTPLGYRDSDAPRERIRDLKRLRELKLLRLFDTESLMVWLGLDRRGRPGLYFRQRNLDEAMPPAAQAAYLLDPPPLRSVPLTSP